MKKAIVSILILALSGVGGYAGYQYLYLPRMAETVGRVSSTSEDAVNVDSVAMLTGVLGSSGLRDRYAGETVAQDTLEIKLDSDKSVDECFVKEGDVVKTGDKLFSYDMSEMEDKIAEAELDIDSNNSQIEQEKKEIEEQEKLKKSADEDEQSSIQIQILQLENSIKQQEYENTSKERSIAQYKESMEEAVVYAEMEGIIQKINTPSDEDSYYSSGSDSAYITILATGDYRIEAKINEQNLQNIYVGMEMLVFSRVDSNKFWYGTISDIDTSKASEEDSDDMYYYYSDDSADTSSYKFYVELEDSSDLILGQHVYMEKNDGQTEQRNGLWLEDYYIGTDESGDTYVWAAGSDNLLHKQKVTLGEHDEISMEYEILDGLTAEDYITFPSESLSEGVPVVYNDTSSDEDDYSEEDYDFDDEDYEYDDEDGDSYDEDYDYDDEDSADEDVLIYEEGDFSVSDEDYDFSEDEDADLEEDVVSYSGTQFSDRNASMAADIAALRSQMSK